MYLTDESARYWAASFIRDCSCKVLDTVVGNKVTSYATVMQLHTKIQEFPELDPSADATDEAGEFSPGTILQRTFLTVLKEIGGQ